MSLPDPIVLVVDPESTGDVTWTFDHYDKVGDKAEFRGDLHSVGVRNHKLEFYRTPPKKSGNFLGQLKAAVKLTVDHTVSGADGTESFRPNILQFSTSVAVGVTPEEYRLMAYMLAEAAIQSYMQELALEMEL